MFRCLPRSTAAPAPMRCRQWLLAGVLLLLAGPGWAHGAAGTRDHPAERVSEVSSLQCTAAGTASADTAMLTGHCVNCATGLAARANPVAGLAWDRSGVRFVAPDVSPLAGVAERVFRPPRIL